MWASVLLCRGDGTEVVVGVSVEGAESFKTGEQDPKNSKNYHWMFGERHFRGRKETERKENNRRLLCQAVDEK